MRNVNFSRPANCKFPLRGVHGGGDRTPKRQREEGKSGAMLKLTRTHGQRTECSSCSELKRSNPTFPSRRIPSLIPSRIDVLPAYLSLSLSLSLSLLTVTTERRGDRPRLSCVPPPSNRCRLRRRSCLSRLVKTEIPSPPTSFFLSLFFLGDLQRRFRPLVVEHAVRQSVQASSGFE